MIGLATGTYTVTRFSPGVVGADARATFAVAETFPTRLSVQPLRGEELVVARELLRSDRVLKAYGKKQLKTVDKTAGTPADQVEIDGEQYEVHHVERQRKLIPHYKTTLVRADR